MSSYLLRLCTVESRCDGILCRQVNKTWQSFGNKTTLKYDDSSNSLHMYITGNSCQGTPGENLSAVIQVVCSDAGSARDPYVMSEDKCNVTIGWNLPTICATIQAHSRQDISSGGINTAALVVSLICIAIIVGLATVLRKQENRIRCRNFLLSRHRRHNFYSKASDDSSDL